MRLSWLKAIIIVALCMQAGHAQKNIDPTPQDIQLARQLREKYKEQDVAILSKNEKISFGFDDKNNNVTVSQIVKEQLMNLGHRADINKFEFYDRESEILEFNMMYRNNKKAKFQVKDEFYTSDDLFYNDYRVKYMQVDFPVQGYSYTYELDKLYKDVKYFTAIYFNEEYPVVKKEVQITVPEWLEIEIKEFNFNNAQIVKTQQADVKNKSVTYTFSAQNLPAFIKEDASPGHSYIYPHILIIARSYTKNNKKNTLFTGTPDLYRWYRSLVQSIDEKPSALKDKVNELIADAKTDDEKIKRIYYWVQDNIRYIAFEDGLAGFRPDASQNVFNKRYGDCKGMANLIRQMLKEAGFDARLTWIGTRHIAYDYSTPSLAVDNHMICTLFKDGRKYFLDGTEKFNSLGEYAERIQGKQVMIEDGDNFIIEKVPVANPSANKETYTASFAINGETLTGKIRGSLKGESRASFLYGYNSIKTDRKETALQYYLTNGDKNLSISNIKTSDITNRDNVLTIDYDAILKNKVSVFDNEMYIDLDYLEEYGALDLTDRQTDYELSYKKDYESCIRLEIPAGYKVAKLPEPIKSDTEGYTVTMGYEQIANNIVYTKRFVFKTGTLRKNEFTVWNDTYQKLRRIYKQQITLIKN